MEEIILFDRLMTGFVLNFKFETATYNVREAQVFSADFDYDRERYASHDVSHKEQTYKDPLNQLVFVEGDFVYTNKTRGFERIPDLTAQVHVPDETEGGCCVDVLSLSRARKVKQISAHDGEEVSGVGFRLGGPGSAWRVYNSLKDALAAFKLEGIKWMTSSGHHSCRLYQEYVRFVSQHPGFYDSHRVEDKNENPMYQLEVPQYQVGDCVGAEKYKTGYYRKKVLSALIRNSRYQKKFGPHVRYKQSKTGPLPQHLKDEIRKAMTVFDNAYRVEVAGIVPWGAYTNSAAHRSALGGVPCASSGMNMGYMLLFRANIDGHEKVLLPECLF